MLKVSSERERLGDLVRRRRMALGLSERAAASQVPMSRNTWSALEGGTKRTSAHKYAAVERVLCWAAGSIEVILTGGDPVETAAAGPPAADRLTAEIERIKSLPLPVESRLAMLRALIELYAEAADDTEPGIEHLAG
jgi:transcriptional regulator with XRE-family HTH domain